MGLYHPPQAQESDSSGNPLSGAKLFCYEVNSSTKKSVYQNKALTIAHTNPVVADSAGRFEPIYTDGAYKFVLALSTASDPPTSSVWEEDNISFGAGDIFSETESITSTTSIDSTYDKKHIRVTGTTTLNLLDIATAGEGFSFSVRNDGTGIVTIDPNASEQINDALTWAIPPGGGGICIAGTEWSFIGTMGIPQTIAANDLLYFDANKQPTAGSSFPGDYTFTGKLLTPTDGTLTIASGAITVTGVYHLVDTESAASVDQLDTISGGSAGQILTLRTADDTHDVVITNAGNIVTPDGNNRYLNSTTSTISLKYDGAKSKWLVEAQAVPNFLMEGLKDRVLNGLTLSNNSGDATNDIDIAAGACVSDDGTTVMNLSAITKQLDASWAVGTNQGGLDTGSIANTTYHLWVINRPDTNVTDVLFSASASSPTMPSNYTKKKCIGSIVRVGATILPFVQLYSEFLLKTPVLDHTTGATAGTSDITATLSSLPTGVKVRAICNGVAVDNGNNVYASSLDTTAIAASTSAAPLSTFGSNGTNTTSQFDVWTNTSAQIRVRQTTNSANGFKIASLGWKDPRI